MAKETASYISQLVATNPVASDSVSVGDDHIRMIKDVLKTQFSGLTGTTAISATEAEMNYLDIATLGTSADSKVLTQASGVVTIAGDVVVSGTTPKVTIGDAGAEDTTLLFDGNAQDYYIALDDSADDLLIGLGSTVGTTPAISIDENLAVKTYGDITMTGTTPTLTIGDAGAEDTAIVFDGNAKDFYVALDDSADKLLIGEGSTVGTNPILSITDDTVTLGDGAAVDTAIVFDGNAKDFHIALDDSVDKLVIGEGSTVGTNEILSITDDTVTIGDGAAVDTYLNFDGNAADFRIGIDDGTDKLEIGGGVAHGTAAGISMDVNGDMTLGGGIACADEVIGRPRFTDYSETLSALGTKTAAFNIDLEDGNVHTLTMSGGGTFNIGLINALSSHSNSVTILGTNLGSCTATFYAGAHDGGGNKVYWADGDDTTNNLMTSSGTDVVTFTTFDGGTKFYGFVAGKGMTNS
jgi:hypothetical protein